MQHRIRIALLNVDGAGDMLLGNRQPWLRGGEAGVDEMRFPDHRRTAPVAPLEAGPEADSVRIAQVLVGEFGFLKAQLLALVEADRAANGRQQRDGELRHGRRILTRSQPARDMPHDIVIGERPADPPVARKLLDRGDAAAQMGGREFRA